MKELKQFLFRSNHKMSVAEMTAIYEVRTDLFKIWSTFSLNAVGMFTVTFVTSVLK